MRKHFYLLFTVAITVSLFFTACNKETDYFADAVPSISAEALANIVLQPANSCGGTVISNLIAGKDFNIPVGKVEVTQNGQYLNVKYEITAPSWFITETHFGIYLNWEDIDGYPLNPQIGGFDFNKDDHNYVKSYTLPAIDLTNYLNTENDFELAIIAHATVVTTNECSCPDGTELPDVVTMVIHYPNAESYFGITISNDGILNGNFDGWCADDDQLIYREISYQANVISSLGGDLTSVVNRPENIFKINYLLNQDLSAYTLGEIQMAIWMLLEEEGGVHDPGGLGPWTQANVDAILAMTDGLTAFTPDCDNPYFAVLLQPLDPATGEPTVQPALIKYCTPKSETAWSAGNDFGISRSWAMWFPFTFCYPF